MEQFLAAAIATILLWIILICTKDLFLAVLAAICVMSFAHDMNHNYEKKSQTEQK
ncbi:hypothetical protein [Stenoxybacter acetivorans]|uniref:hypothetical protein n=1 Tax=Stenoxybacter acetivorans TaxID=422441 RepID=UPI0012ECB1B6|nr:hypothetical protein [Stenoxybacter acetivorans]